MAAAAPFPFAAEAAALASSVLWAGAGIVFRRMRGVVPPAALNFTKNGVATLCFVVTGLVFTGRAYPSHVPLAAQGWLALSGLVGLAVCDTFLLRAMMEIGPRRATLLMLTAPVLVFVGALFPPFSQTGALHEPRTLVGAALALGGVALTAFEAPDLAVDPARARRGVIDGLVAGVLQAAGVLLARLGLEGGAAPQDAAMLRLVAGTAGLVLGAVAFGRVTTWARALATPGTLRTVAAAAFFGTFLGILLNQCGLAWSAHTGVVSTLNALAPVWLIPMSRVFLGEHHGRLAWLSTVVALAGVALLSA
ncbi:MAG: DMT family transporter [Planctomycetota bacterium]